MDLPKRKDIRLKNYDYSLSGTYFITMCVKDRKAILSNIVVGASIARPKEIRLTRYGEVVQTAINNIPKYYPVISVENCVIMPDHIHLLLRIRCDENGLAISGPKINRVIQQVKGVITKEIGFSIWQKSYNDHIVRGLEDYKNIWEYIENNPLK